MKIINNLFGNMPFYGRKGKITAQDKFDLMHSSTIALDLSANVLMYPGGIN